MTQKLTQMANRKPVLPALLLGALLAALLVPLTSAPAAASPAYRILITGDSITQGSAGDYTWRYRLWNKLASTAPGDVQFVGTRTDLFDDVHNVQGSHDYAVDFGGEAHSAVWGDSFTKELDNVGDQVSSTNANVLVVMLGSNDLAYLTSPAATIDNLRTYITRARAAHPGLDVVVGEVVNRYDLWSGNYLITPQVDEYAGRLRTLASEMSTSGERVVIAPTRTGWDAAQDTWDGTHPNPTGESLIAQRVSEGLAQLGIGAASPDIAVSRSWDVAGPAPALTPGSEQIGIDWDRTPSGATGMYIEQRLTDFGEAWHRLPYAVAGDGWTSELLVAGGTYQLRLVPSKGTSVGVPGPAATATADGPTPGPIASVTGYAGGTSIYGGVQAHAYWSSSGNANGYLLSYRLQSNGTMAWDDLPYPVTDRDWVFEPLETGRRYQFRVRGVRGFLRGSWGTSGSTRTIGLAGHRTYVALGDSYSSGLGSSGTYDESCHRTSHAWSTMMESYFQDARLLTACAGDTISGVENQLPDMQDYFAAHPGKPQLITLTVGGNDIGFKDLIVDCIMNDCSSRGPELAAKMDALQPRLADLYRQIKAEEPYADIVVGGYPWVVEPDGDSMNIGCLPLDQNERNMITGISSYLNQTISDAASSAGVWSVGQRVRDIFVHHNACQGGDDEWINAVSVDPGGLYGFIDVDSFHPKDPGQLAYAIAFDDAVQARIQ